MALTQVHNRMIKGAKANILDYGADPTGVADSTAAIQAAINANTLGDIYIPEGVFKITDTLVMAGGAQNLIGEGQRSILTLDGFISGQAAIQNHGTSGVRRSNQIFRDFQIFSDNNFGIGISLEFIERGVYKNIWFYNLETMVSVTDQCYITIFESLKGYGINQKSFLVDALAFNNNTLINCTFGGTGFLLKSAASAGIAFIGCDFEGCSYDASYPAAAYFQTSSSLALTGISGISFNGCYWESNNASGIILDALGISGNSYDGISGVSINGCFFTGGYNDVGHANATYVLQAYNAHGVSVTGNYFSDFKDAVVYDGGGNGPWVFEGNTIGKNTLGVERIPAFANTVLLGGPGGYVKNNGNLSRREFQGTTTPVSGAHIVGDIVWNNAPSAGTNRGWICVSAGSPGTWKKFGAIQGSSAYTTSNVTTDRTIDADSTTTAEIADVLCTLIEDLKTAGILS